MEKLDCFESRFLGYRLKIFTPSIIDIIPGLDNYHIKPYNSHPNGVSNWKFIDLHYVITIELSIYRGVKRSDTC